MKQSLILILFLILNSLVNAQELKIPNTHFPEQEDPLHVVLGKYDLNSPESLNGNIKTITVTQNHNYGDDKYSHFITTHYFNTNNKRTISTYQTIVNDCCGEELKNTLDTIYPNKNLQINKIDKHKIETIDAVEDDLKTTYHMSNGKPTHTITKDNEVYFMYSKMDQLIERKGSHLVKGYRGEDDEIEYTRYKYNNFLESGYYNYLGQLNKVKKVFYEHYFDTYGESKITYTYNDKGQLSQRTEKSSTYLVKNFDPTKALLNQEWMDKTIDSQNFTTYTYEYDDKARLTSQIITDKESTSHHKITYTATDITIEFVAFVGTEKEVVTEIQTYTLDAKGNPTSLKTKSLNEDGKWIDNTLDELNITYQYYN